MPVFLVGYISFNCNIKLSCFKRLYQYLCVSWLQLLVTYLTAATPCEFNASSILVSSQSQKSRQRMTHRLQFNDWCLDTLTDRSIIFMALMMAISTRNVSLCSVFCKLECPNSTLSRI